ncbi:LysR family transcriptional regulator [bacterium LRH843]|nr:LysR family transcriptional regulator [bacterium LRH843]
MDLRTIKTFRTIVKYGSFQQAAEELKYAQSTVTTHIKKLEGDLGVTLLERGNNLKLTEAGRLLNEKGELLLKTFENVKNSMAELVEGNSGVIRIGVMEPMASYRFPALLTSFIKHFPEVQISLQIHGSKVLTDMVMKDEIDLALCAAPEMNGEIVFEPIYSEEVVLLTPTEHRLSEKDIVYLTDLENEKLVITNIFCPFRANFEKKMIEIGISPLYGIEVSNMLTLKYYVQSGFGAAVVPLITVNPAPEGTVVKPIVSFRQGLTVGIIKKAEYQSNKPMTALLDLIKSYNETSN